MTPLGLLVQDRVRVEAQVHDLTTMYWIRV
jgi:hypothetical protein